MTDTTSPEPSGKAADYAALAALGIAKVEIIYDGSSDSGCIEKVTAYDDAGQEMAPLPDGTLTVLIRDTVWDAAAKAYQTRFTAQEMSIRNAITHWCYELLEEHFPGWELDSGSNGTITIDIAAHSGAIEHESRYTETVSDSARFS